MNFIHLADVHLGYRQYDLEQRFKDLGITFKKIVEHAISSGAEFVIISGDLFDKRSINAPTFVQANHVLSMLKEAGIPCIVIEGNHDRRFLKDGMSWLESLEWQGLLKVIKNTDESLMGGYVDIGRTRVFGMSFAGSMTSSIIPRIALEIKEINARNPPEYTILMMHAGVEGKIKGSIIGEVTYEQLCPLKECVNYLALGHYHIAYDIDGWVYNPGSPDTCSIAEVNEPKGFYQVKDGPPKLLHAEIRPFSIINIVVDNIKDAESLSKAIEDKASCPSFSSQPVVHVILRGTLNFDRSHIDTDAIIDMVRTGTDALYVDLRFDLLNDEFCISRLESDSFDRSSIEREVFRKLAAADSMLADKGDLFASSLSEIKDLAVKGADERTLDVLLRKIYEEMKREGPSIKEAIPVIVEPINVSEPDAAAKPVKKPRKKASKPGQLALDLGDEP